MNLIDIARMSSGQISDRIQELCVAGTRYGLTTEEQKELNALVDYQEYLKTDARTLTRRLHAEREARELEKWRNGE